MRIALMAFYEGIQRSLLSFSRKGQVVWSCDIAVWIGIQQAIKLLVIFKLRGAHMTSRVGPVRLFSEMLYWLSRLITQ